MTKRGQQSAMDAYAALRAEIMSGRLTPNERLVEQALVERYGLTRAAIRMALVRLEQDGVVVREAHRGARVRMVSESEAVEILEARAALEGLAARQAALRAADDDISQLRRLAEEMAALHEAGDLLAMSECNARLHRLIVALSGHHTVQKLTSMLNTQMVRFQYRTILGAGRPGRSLAEHVAIVDAIARHDSEEAERAMREHLSNVALALHGRAETEAPGELAAEASG